MNIETTDVTIPAMDGFSLAGTIYQPETGQNKGVVVINSATAAPRQFYKHFARYLAQAGYTVLTHDYRGIGGSRPANLRGFSAYMHDWALQDMAGVVEYATSRWQPRHLHIIGHSIGGQAMGMLPNAAHISSMVTLSAQSGYWGLQGGNQKGVVRFHVNVTFPLLAHLFGYLPWSRLGASEDLPKGVALEWARWCRDPDYLLGDDTLPLERYAQFTVPVLAYSVDDDDWGTPQSVDAMMSAYPNLERQHIVPSEAGINSLGHFGFFRPKAEVLWADVLEWMSKHEE